jgi:hypothetical protein
LFNLVSATHLHPKQHFFRADQQFGSFSRQQMMGLLAFKACQTFGALLERAYAQLAR